MSNWAAWKEKEIGLPVVKRAKHGIHFDAGKGLVQAEFVGKPCHYFDGKLWQAIDTKPLLRKDGSYGCPHSDVIIHTDGTVQLGEYRQKAALIYPGKISVDGDRIARPFSGGVQYLYITEDGYRQEIVLEKMPDLRKVSALVDTVKGVLPTKYTASSLSLKDSSTAELSDFVQVGSKSLASVLEAAKYPVVIDPDFSGDTADGYITSYSKTTYSESRTTSASFDASSVNLPTGQRTGGATLWGVYRSFLKFDTSTIGVGSTVTQANLKLAADTDTSTAADFDVQIVKQDWSSQDPLSNDNREAAFDGCLAGTADDNIWRNTSGMSVDTVYTSGNLATAWVSKTGVTYYSLRSSRDYAETTAEGFEWCNIASANHGTEGLRPVLAVLYTEAPSGIFIPVNFSAQMQALSAGMRG